MNKPQVFIDIRQDEIVERAAQYCERGWRFANLCASTVEGGVELLYSFSDGWELENLRFTSDLSVPIASVSGCFPNAFIFENETHDLFGVPISGISVDFKGAFYTTSVPNPMNPGALANGPLAVGASIARPDLEDECESGRPMAAPTTKDDNDVITSTSPDEGGGNG
jgi:ech hydrogenase subunit D